MRIKIHFVLAVIFALAGQSFGAGWWSLDYTHRRGVTIASARHSGLPGDDVAVVTMATGGLCRPDGNDIRVATHDGKERPLRLLMVGPGDQVSLAFAIQPGVTNYHVYLGCKKDPPPSKPLEINRGVLLETWFFKEGQARTLEQAVKTLEKNQQFIGRGFRNNIFQGHNAFGPENRVINVFTAYLQCTGGAYTFGSASRDASFLLIDDKLVVDCGGMHEVAPVVMARGQVHLTPGLHKLTYYHLTGAANPVCVAAWQPPGADKIWTIPPEAFAPVTRATSGPLEQYGREMTIDFQPIHNGEAFTADRYYQRYSFKALTSGPVGKLQWTWDFGDGQSAVGGSAEHVYLLPGEYTVKLKTTGAYGLMERVNKIFVSRPWDRVMHNDLDSLQMYGQMVSIYNFSSLPVESLPEAAILLNESGKIEAVVAVGKAMLKHDKAPAAVIEQIMPLYIAILVGNDQHAQAAKDLLKSAEMTAEPATQAAMKVAAAEQLMELAGKDDLQQAMEVYEGVVRKYEALTSNESIRQARIGIGDVWRLRADLDKAVHAYKAAGQKPNNAASASITRGDLARHVEDHIRQKHFAAAEDSLRQWEQTFPADKLEGYWSLLKCNLLMASGKVKTAITEAATLVTVNPGSNYAPQLLMLQAQAHERLKDTASMQEALKKIVNKYKESPLAAEAAKRLGTE